MGNCALKPATKEGEAPVPERPEDKPVESTDREVTLDTKEEEKKPEAVEAVEVVKPVEEKPAESSEPPKVEETTPVEEKKVDVVAN